MIAENFNSRIRANMEVALEEACKLLRTGAEQHENRRYIANSILQCAESGDTTLGGLTEAARLAASELCESGMRARGSRPKTNRQ